MPTATLDDFMSWNDQLVAAVQAGVPLDIGLDDASGDAALALEKINALIARRTSQGATLAAAAEDTDVPPSYNCLLQLALVSGTPVTGLALSNRLANKVDSAWNVGRLAFLYPLIVCGLAFFGIVGFCLFFVPVLRGTYDSLDVKAGMGLYVLEVLRDSMKYWAAIVPIGLVFAVAWVNRTSNSLNERRRERLLDWIPGVSGAIFDERAANFAETVATLLENNVPVGEALRIAAPSWNDRKLADATQELARRKNNDLAIVAADDGPRHFPPFLRWALVESETTTGRVCALRVAANIYRQAAASRQDQLRIIVPLLAAVLIGGAATLAYGLTLFVPVIEMLGGLASQYAG
jgi:type II secretory pathway component PulF